MRGGGGFSEYCCREHQKEHWKAHKELCKRIQAGKGSKGQQEDLQIGPWTPDTPYEVIDREFDEFEKCFEKHTAAFAAKHMGAGKAPSYIVVGVERQKKPLNLT